MVVAGKSSKEIARALYISRKTVELHRADIMKKMAVQGVAELVRVAITSGMVLGSMNAVSREDLTQIDCEQTPRRG